MKLLNSKVLLIGAGGLGAPAALYLAAAGVGTLGVVDDDRVDESNLQRQVIHNTERVGMAKTESARLSIKARNQPAKAIAHVEKLLPLHEQLKDWAGQEETLHLLGDLRAQQGELAMAAKSSSAERKTA